MKLKVVAQNGENVFLVDSGEKWPDGAEKGFVVELDESLVHPAMYLQSAFKEGGWKAPTKDPDILERVIVLVQRKLKGKL